MVKKLLILVLVLGMVSTASAALSLQRNDVEVPSSVGWVSGQTIQLHSSDTSTWSGMVFNTVGSQGTLSNARFGPASAGDQGGIYGPYDYSGAPYYLGIGYGMQSDFLTTAPVAGVQFLIDLTGNLDDTGTINFFTQDNFTTPTQSFNYTIIPEPMTIALLGLGGLLLRRRK